MANVLILYPLKAPQSQRFSGAFKGFKMGTLGRNRLKVQFRISKNTSLPLLLASNKLREICHQKKTDNTATQNFSIYWLTMRKICPNTGLL